MPPLTRIGIRMALGIMVVAAFVGALLATAKSGFVAFAPTWAPLHGSWMVFGGVTQLAFAVAYWILPRGRGGSRGNPAPAVAAFVLLDLGLAVQAVRVLLAPALTQAMEAALWLSAFGAFALHIAPRVLALRVAKARS